MDDDDSDVGVAVLLVWGKVVNGELFNVKGFTVKLIIM